jgi:hypothetical protein
MLLLELLGLFGAFGPGPLVSLNNKTTTACGSWISLSCSIHGIWFNFKPTQQATTKKLGVLPRKNASTESDDHDNAFEKKVMTTTTINQINHSIQFHLKPTKQGTMHDKFNPAQATTHNDPPTKSCALIHPNLTMGSSSSSTVTRNNMAVVLLQDGWNMSWVLLFLVIGMMAMTHDNDEERTGKGYLQEWRWHNGRLLFWVDILQWE